MTLDEPANAKHAAMLESEDHPGWLEMARRQEAAEARARAAENRELLASESVEAEEARWDYRFARRAVEIPEVHYS